MTKRKPQDIPPLTAEEEAEVIAWFRKLEPSDQRNLLEMARKGDTPTRKVRRSFNAGRGRDFLF